MPALWTSPRPAFHPAVFAEGLWFTAIPVGLAPWHDLARIRIATCPWLGCERYTSVFALNVDGSIGEPIVGWAGGITDGPHPAEYWWDERPWCWFVTDFLDSGAGSGNQTYTSPLDWNNANNTIEILAAGASGGSAASTTASERQAAGGGGGAYQKYVNFTFAAPGTTTATYNLGAGGAAVTSTIGNATNGNPGSDAWFDGATYGAATVGAKGGSGGSAGITSSGVSAGAGGLASGGIGNSSAVDGGTGTAVASGQNTGATGGGGSAGPAGAGGNSQATNVGANLRGTNGGAGGAPSGGAAGVGNSTGTPGGNGGNGTCWDLTHGGGGGGGGCAMNSANDIQVGGDGGNYGAGGGAACSRTNGGFGATSGAGKPALIVLTSIPPYPGVLSRSVRATYLRR